jgi:NADPH:quinone reductase-like Zn-dependent oxidoreductase
MKAAVLPAFDAAPTVRDHLPEPMTAAGELAVRVHPTVHRGAWAELIAVSEETAASKPAGVDPVAAGALDRLARLLEAGTLRAPIQRSYQLDQAGDALAALPATHTQGKLALAIDR